MMNNDEDEFAPNPFRSDTDFLGAPAPAAAQPDPFAPQQQQQMYPPPQQQQQLYPQQQQQPQYNNNTNYDANRIDPNSGMTGSLNTFPPPVQQQQPPPIQDPGMYLSGTMDQKNAANNNNNYGSTGSTSTSLFSVATLLKCCRFDTFTEYFNVDSIDIYCRLKGSIVKFYQPDQFRTSILGDNTSNNNEEQDPVMANAAEDDDDADSTNTNNSMMIAGSRRKGPDLYGPFWIATTLMFVLGMTSNLSDYMHHVTSTKKNDDDPDSPFEYNINHLLRAMSVVSIMAFLVPTFFWLTCQCLGMPQIKLAMWVCIYGYSFTWLLIGSLVAWWLPYEIYHIVILAITTSLSGLLVIRNLSTPLLSQDAANHAKAAPLLLAILGTHFCFFLALKVLFFT